MKTWIGMAKRIKYVCGVRSTRAKSNAIRFIEWFITFGTLVVGTPPSTGIDLYSLHQLQQTRKKKTLSILLKLTSIRCGNFFSFFVRPFCSARSVSFHHNQNKKSVSIHITYCSVFTIHAHTPHSTHTYTQYSTHKSNIFRSFSLF